LHPSRFISAPETAVRYFEASSSLSPGRRHQIRGVWLGASAIVLHPLLWQICPASWLQARHLQGTGGVVQSQKTESLTLCVFQQVRTGRCCCLVPQMSSLDLRTSTHRPGAQTWACTGHRNAHKAAQPPEFLPHLLASQGQEFRDVQYLS
jgi:hypothetical protein